MLLNMVMFKVTICDFGKMNINMTDKIEKRRQPLQCRTMARTTTTMSMARASAAMTAACEYVPFGEVFVEERNNI